MPTRAKDQGRESGDSERAGGSGGSRDRKRGWGPGPHSAESRTSDGRTQEEECHVSAMPPGAGRDGTRTGTTVEMSALLTSWVPKRFVWRLKSEKSEKLSNLHKTDI